VFDVRSSSIAAARACRPRREMMTRTARRRTCLTCNVVSSRLPRLRAVSTGASDQVKVEGDVGVAEKGATHSTSAKSRHRAKSLPKISSLISSPCIQTDTREVAPQQQRRRRRREEVRREKKVDDVNDGGEDTVVRRRSLCGSFVSCVGGSARSFVRNVRWFVQEATVVHCTQRSLRFTRDKQRDAHRA
jgi:hypothetical protein